MNFQEKIKQIEALKKEVGKDLAKDLIEGLIPLMPEGYDQVYWTQYVPYFNDGDECVFGVSDVWVYKSEWFNGETPFMGSRGEEVEISQPVTINGSVYEDYLSAEGLSNVSREAYKFFASVPEDLIQECFGSHSCVLLDLKNRTVTTEEYDHD